MSKVVSLERIEPNSPLGFKFKGGTDKPYENAEFDADGVYVSKLEKP